MVLDKRKRFKAKDDFLECYDALTEWSEDIDYNDYRHATPNLQSWFLLYCKRGHLCSFRMVGCGRGSCLCTHNGGTRRVRLLKNKMKAFGKIKQWLQGLSFRTGVIVLLCCIPHSRRTVAYP